MSTKLTNDLKTVYSFAFPIGTEDPANSKPGTAYYNEATDRLRIFGTRWGTIGIVWDD